VTLLFIDGFDHYAANTDGGMNSIVTTDQTSAPGRFGDGRYKTTNGGGVIFPTTLTSFVMGVAIISNYDAGGWYIQLGSVYINGNLDGLGAISIANDNTQYSWIRRSNNGLVYANVWSYIEVKMNTVANTVEVRLNGVAVPGLPATTVGWDISGVGSALINPGSWVRSTNIDDFYLCDTNGSVNNDFLGDVRVETIRPSSAGSSTTWSTSTVSGVNYQMVDESITNDDTDYVYTNVLNNKDLYGMSDLSTATTGTVLGVQVNVRARKTDSGTRGIKSVAKVGASEADSIEYGTISTSWLWFWDLRENKPGGTGWTIAEVNSMEAGVKVTT
jgi:hypothetical protein